MRKIHIIGGPGSGKSWLSAQLHGLLALPVIELDELHWDNNTKSYGVLRGEAERESMLNHALAQADWIIEGVYYKWLRNSFAAADVIIILETPSLTRNLRIMRRFVLRKMGRQRAKNEGLGDLWDLLVWGQRYQKEKLPEIMSLTEVYKRKRMVFASSAKAYEFFRDNVHIG